MNSRLGSLRVLSFPNEALFKNRTCVNFLHQVENIFTLSVVYDASQDLALRVYSVFKDLLCAKV